MLVQDSLTGNLHEVPDRLSGYGDYGAGDQIVYDGLGNPVGRLSGIFDDIGRAVGSVVSAIPRAVSSIPQALSQLPGGGPLSLLAPLAAAGPLGLLGKVLGGTPAPAAAPVQAPASAFANPLTPSGWPMPFNRPPFGLPAPYWRRSTPWPAGWVRPQLPYTGQGPQRLYMRCAVWPGPKGLVPGFAALGPAQAQAAAMQQAAALGRRHRRHHRRR
jgi:hypothetical protein